MAVVTAAAVPAHNLEAEESVLGAMMVAGPGAIALVRDTGLRAEDFYRESHRTIYRAVVDLAEREVGVDPLTVSAELDRRGDLEAAGGKADVHQLPAVMPAAGNAARYAEIVRDAARVRRTQEIGRDLSEIQTWNGEIPDHAERLRELVADAEGNGHALRSRPADLARVRPIRWAWSGRLLLGYLCLLLGAEGVGKGTLLAWIIGQITRGGLPGDLAGQPSRVLIVGDEDSFDSVIVPRLYAAGADLALVDTLHEEDDGDLLDLRRDAAALRELVRDGGYALVALDSLLDTLGLDVDDWRAKQVRDALRPLRRMARDLDVCVLGSLHPNKGSRSSFRDLVSGTYAFNASSRSSLLLAPHPEDDRRRVLVRGKGNLSAPPPSFEFTIEGRVLDVNGHTFDLPVVAGEHEGELSIEDLVKPERAAPVRDTLTDQIEAIGTGEVQTRAEIARAVGREPHDGSVGRALNQLEADGRWIKEARGKWRRLVIATSREMAMSKADGEGTS